jgi:hypothetical protein
MLFKISSEPVDANKFTSYMPFLRMLGGGGRGRKEMEGEGRQRKMERGGKGGKGRTKRGGRRRKEAEKFSKSALGKTYNNPAAAKRLIVLDAMKEVRKIPKLIHNKF